VLRLAVPDDWEPSQGCIDNCAMSGVACASDQVVIFRAWAKAEGKTFADLDAAFLKFALNGKNFDARRRGRAHLQKSAKDYVDDWVEQRGEVDGLENGGGRGAA